MAKKPGSPAPGGPDAPREGPRDVQRATPGTPRRSPWSYLLLLAALLFLVVPMLTAHQRATLSYSEFKVLLHARQVDSLLLGTDHITGTLRLAGIDSILPPARASQLRSSAGDSVSVDFTTARVEDDPALVDSLVAAHVAFSGSPSNGWLEPLLIWVLPLVVIFGFSWYMLRRMGPRGAMAIGRSQARVYMERTTGVTFADVAGIDEARAELMEVVDFLRNPDRYRRLGGRIPKGVLLVGAPGTGKTLLAKAVAGEARVPFFSINGSDFVEMFVGVGAARVRDLFVQAQAHAPSIIFIDELDALGRARSASSILGGHEEREQTLNQLLAQMDGFDTGSGVILLAATNRPEILDPALMRPGRFDRKVVLDRPDLKGREQILRVHARGVVLGPDVDLGGIAARTPGFVGADLANLINEAALAAGRAGKRAVELVDFENAIDRVIAGLERKSRVITPKEKKIVAYHESGHALVAEERPTADRVARISVIPRGIGALGYTRQLPTEDRYLLTQAELLDRLDVLLGGRVAEEVVFGEVSTGAQDDLQKATDLARQMVTRFGMSEELGIATYENPRQPMFLDVPTATTREFSESTARVIDEEVRRILDDGRARVYRTLMDHREVLDRLALLLMEHEVVDRVTLVELLQREPAHVA